MDEATRSIFCAQIDYVKLFVCD